MSAVTKDTPDQPSVSVTMKGLEIILDLFEELDIRGTFFIEASILPPINARRPDLLKRLNRHDIGNHGYAHEDFTGTLTGVKLERNRVESILKQAIAEIEAHLKKPKGFRAPYLNFDRQLAEAISTCFDYDSSITLKQATTLKATAIEGLTIPELPLITTKDAQGKPISTYLWQLLEGRRPVKDYLRIVAEKKQDPNFPFTIFALHPWHLAYHIGKKEILKTRDVEKNKRKLKEFLSKAEPFGTVEDALRLMETT